MLFSNKIIDKVVILRIVVGDLVLNQNLNMALSHYGLNLKELKLKLDSFTSNFPKGLYFYFNFILYKNNTYDIILKGPTLSSCILTTIVTLSNSNVLSIKDPQSYNVTSKELILCYKLKSFYNDLLPVSFYSDSFYSILGEYKQVLGTFNSFKTL